MKTSWSVAACYLLVSASVSLAAGPPSGAVSQGPKLFGNFNPKAGVWSEYSVKEKDTGKTYKMRMAIVGQEGDSYWYEVVNDEGSTKNIIKMLVKGNPNDPENIQRQIIKSGDSPAVEMHRDFVVMGRRMAALMFEKRSGVPATGAAVKVEEVGEKQIQVPAGSFKVKEQRLLDAEGKVLATSDYNADVLPFGVVMSDTESTRMELLGNGSGAKSMITEEPVPMTSPRGMPAGMPRGYPPGMDKGLK